MPESRSAAWFHPYRLLPWSVLAMFLCVLPFCLTYSQKEILTFATINVILVVSYRHLTLTGEWSLFLVVMMGCGAYGSALAAKLVGLPVPMAILSGGVVAAVVGWLLSYPLFRMKGFHFLIGLLLSARSFVYCGNAFAIPSADRKASSGYLAWRNCTSDLCGSIFFRSCFPLFLHLGDRPGVHLVTVAN